MAQDALSILTTGSTKDKLAEIRGAIIDAIRAKCVSTLIKNNNYSGDPESGSVIFDRFKDAELNNYGTARTNSKGTALKNSGKVILNIDTDKEIVEEIEFKDVTLSGINGLLDRRTASHAGRIAAFLDKEFFRVAEAAAVAVTITPTVTAIEDKVEELISKAETLSNDWVDGMDRSDLVITCSPKGYGKLRNLIDKIPGNDGSKAEAIELFHGVRVINTVRQTADIMVQRMGSVGQLAIVNKYNAEKVPLSNSLALSIFVSEGTKAVTPDTIFKVATI